MSEEKNEIEEIEEQQVIEVEAQAPASKYWATALVFIVLILAISFLSYQTSETVQNVAKRAGNTFLKVFRPVVYNKELVMSTYGKLSSKSKLVVMTQEITVDVEKSSTKKFMWNYYSLGTTTVRMTVPGNKVQYYIPTDSLNENSIRWDEEKQELILNLPDPILDEEIVEIQSDPSKIMIKKEIGWARLESKSGKAIEEQVRKQLRSRVIEAGKEDLRLKQAKENAEIIVRDLFNKLKKDKDSTIFV